MSHGKRHRFLPCLAVSHLVSHGAAARVTVFVTREPERTDCCGHPKLQHELTRLTRVLPPLHLNAVSGSKTL